MPTCDAYKTIASLNQILASRKFGADSDENFVVLADAVQHLKIGLDVNAHLNSCLDDFEAEIRRLHSELATMERCREEKYSMACQERDAMAKRLVEAERELAEVKAAFDGAKLGMKALNELLVKTKSERDGLAAALCKNLDACDHCKYNGVELPCGDMVPAPECDECMLETAICCKCYAGSGFEFAGVGDGK